MIRRNGMKVNVKLFGHFRNIANSKEVDVDARGHTVNDVVSALVERFPELGPAVLENDQVRPYVNLFLNGKNIKELNGLATGIKEGDGIVLFPPMAGG